MAGGKLTACAVFNKMNKSATSAAAASSSSSSSSSAASLFNGNSEIIISKDLSSQSLSCLSAFLNETAFSKSNNIPADLHYKDSYSDIIRSALKLRHLHRGRVSCFLLVKPSLMNVYGGMHGGVVAAVAELVSIACARTVVGKDKEVFLGELSISYLAAAPRNAEVIVDASVVKSGRNLTVISVEFRLKDSEQVVYLSRATFYNMPIASL